MFSTKLITALIVAVSVSGQFLLMFPGGLSFQPQFVSELYSDGTHSMDYTCAQTSGGDFIGVVFETVASCITDEEGDCVKFADLNECDGAFEYADNWGTLYVADERPTRGTFCIEVTEQKSQYTGTTLLSWYDGKTVQCQGDDDGCRVYANVGECLDASSILMDLSTESSYPCSPKNQETDGSWCNLIKESALKITSVCEECEITEFTSGGITYTNVSVSETGIHYSVSGI